jgi:DNA invertase Pin-like site-specific DNA recombinase
MMPNADLTAIYCRKSRKGDKQQITVTRQKRLALSDCQALGLTVSPEHIYIDNGASAWQRNRKRPGWDQLVAAARRGEIKHIVCYHPDRLMRQPFDLEELLSISDDHGIMLYGRVNARDLQDPDDRYALRIEIAHACRSSDDTSRRLKDQKQERAENGYYNGTRPFGYTKNGMKVVPEEANIVREIFDRFIKGETPHSISTALNQRGLTTSRGKPWHQIAVVRALSNRHVAGICVHRGEEIGIGKWPVIIPRSEWDFVQELLTYRSSAAQSRNETRQRRYYLLRGLVVCGNCGTTMAGCSGTMYRCSRAVRQDSQRCARSMLAEPLEKFVEDAAISLLSGLTVNSARPRTATTETAERNIAEDEQQMRDLHDMWLSKEIDSTEYRKDRRIIQARIRENERKLIAKAKPMTAISDLLGPDAQAKWTELSEERRNNILRFLFAAVIIGPGTMNRHPTSMDFSRVEIEQNELA